jgi:hypothetical protein
VPEFPRDVHDLEGLAGIARFVFEAGEEEVAVGG